MMPTAKRTLISPGPVSATIASAKRMLGNASMMSISRMITVSAQPPRKPATAPSSEPIRMASDTELKPINSDTRAPYNIRLSWSRPSWSVPSGWPHVGSARDRRGLTAQMPPFCGCSLATTGASTAARASPPMMHRPANANRLRSTRRAASRHGVRTATAAVSSNPAARTSAGAVM